MVGVDQGIVLDGEWVFRRVARDRHVYDENLGRRHPSSLAFMQGGRDSDTSCYKENDHATDAALGRRRNQRRNHRN